VTDPASPRRDRRSKDRSDAELVQATREGDRLAFATLWDRHAEAARRVARAVAWTADPDDLVSEAFTRILRATQGGGGPTEAFRPYLFATIKNIAVSWSKEAPTVPLDEVREMADESQPDPAMLIADRTALARAFRTLPERWRTVLWYLEVEGMTPRELAPILGISANSVAALSYRAREGFRKAWMELHLQDEDRSAECRWATEYVLSERGSGRRGHRSDQVRLDRHIADCAACRILAADEREPSQQLRAVLLALTLGSSAAAYSQVHSPAPAAALAIKPSVAPAAYIAASVGVVLAVSGITAALLAPPEVPESSVIAVSPPPASTPPPVPPRPTPTVAPTPLPQPTPMPTPDPAPPVPRHTSTAAPRPTPPAEPAPAPRSSPKPTPRPTPSPAPTPTPIPTPTPAPPPAPVPVPVSPAPAFDTPADLDAPVPAPITGTGVAGAGILALDGEGDVIGSATVAGDGAFSLVLQTDAMQPGSSVRLVQTAVGMTASKPSAAIGPFALPVPQITGMDGTSVVARSDADGDGGVDDIRLLLSGIPGAHLIVAIDGVPTGRVHLLLDEPLIRYAPDMPVGEHAFTVRYYDPAVDRSGRPHSVLLTVVDDPDGGGSSTGGGGGSGGTGGLVDAPSRNPV
jgi:RNA polymerase sigma factor (sigma-70 family)